MTPFEIVTLSDRNRSLGDPVTIITGGIALIQSLFPNIFGSGRHRLTDQDWNQLITGNGYWTSALRSYLKQKIHYDADLKNIELFSKYFAYENKIALGLVNYSGAEFMQKFYEIINKEKMGINTGGTVPGFITSATGIDTTTLLLIGGAVVLLFALNKK